MKRVVSFFIQILVASVFFNTWGGDIFETDGIIYKKIDASNCEVIGCNADLVDVVIPTNACTPAGGRYRVAGIADSAFQNNTLIGTLTINIAAYDNYFIGNSAFKDCTSLSDIKFEKDEKGAWKFNSIKDEAFRGCVSLKQLDLSNSELGDYAFADCVGLESLSLNLGDRSGSYGTIYNEMGNGAFQNCTSLKELTLYNGTFLYGCSNVFAGCDAFKKIIVKSAMKGSSLSGFPLLEEVEYYQIEDQYADWWYLDTLFKNCKSLRKITFVPYEKSYYREINLPEQCFDGCTSLSELVFGGGLTKINKYAFKGCDNLREFTFPKMFNACDSLAFNGGASLKTLNFEPFDDPKRGAQKCSEDIDVFYTQADFPNPSVTVHVSLNTANARGLSAILQMVDYGVLTARYNLGQGIEEVKAVYDHNNYWNYPVKLDVQFPINQGCFDLDLIYSQTASWPLSGGPVYDTSTFKYGNVASFKNIYLMNVPQPIEIKENTFALSELESLSLGRRISGVYENEPFADFKQLKQVLVYGDYTDIPAGYFSDCPALQKVFVGTAVKSVGARAFAGCSEVSEIVCSAVVPPVCGEDVFDGIDTDNCTLLVPQGCEDAYKNAAQWCKFYGLDEPAGYNIPLVPEENGLCGVYNLNGVRVADTTEGLAPGFYIVRQGQQTKKLVIR